MNNRILKDSLNNSIDSIPIINNSTLGVKENVDIFLHEHAIILIPVLLILLASLFKYYLGNKFADTSLLEFFFELPVDLGFLSLSFVITYIFMKDNDTTFCILLTIMSLFVGALAALLRRTALNEFEKEDSNFIKIGFISLPNFIITGLLVTYIITII
jgi:hypothetical protein|tara:strand:- start:781 stop:1254 length:474 start_codon:yes stop_codon:yes gene_type:complete